MIVEQFPKLKDGNYVVDVHNGLERLFYVVVPHQMVCHWKNFWGAELTTMEYKGLKPQAHVGNQPIKEKIFEYINETPQTIEELNRKLRSDKYNTHFCTDIKPFIYKLKAEDKVITQYENRIMKVRTP